MFVVVVVVACVLMVCGLLFLLMLFVCAPLCVSLLCACLRVCLSSAYCLDCCFLHVVAHLLLLSVFLLVRLRRLLP